MGWDVLICSTLISSLLTVLRDVQDRAWTGRGRGAGEKFSVSSQNLREYGSLVFLFHSVGFYMMPRDTSHHSPCQQSDACDEDPLDDRRQRCPCVSSERYWDHHIPSPDTHDTPGTHTHPQRIWVTFEKRFHDSWKFNGLPLMAFLMSVIRPERLSFQHRLIVIHLEEASSLGDARYAWLRLAVSPCRLLALSPPLDNSMERQTLSGTSSPRV